VINFYLSLSWIYVCICWSVLDSMYCDVTVRPRAKVTIDSLYESLGTKLNNLDICLQVVSTTRKLLDL